MSDRCAYEFDIEAWEEEHDRRCELDSDEEIVEDGVWHCPHEAVAGHDECIFHLAPEDRPDEADASEAFVEAVEGDASNEFIGVVFPEFDLSRRELDAEEEVDLRHAKVGNLDWNGATIDVDFNASGVIFGVDSSDIAKDSVGPSNFDNVAINRLKLVNATFRRGMTSIEADFRCEVYFQSATFQKDVDFSWALFGGEADFSFINFEAGANLSDILFEDKADFTLAEFKSGANFSWTRFGSDTDFGGAMFSEGAEFSYTTFKSESDFGGVKFRGEASFLVATFESNVEFSSATFGGSVDFNDTVFKSSADFKFVDFKESTTFGHLAMLPYAPFIGPIDFSDATFDSTPEFMLSYGGKDDVESHTTYFGTDIDFSNATLPDGFFLPEVHAYGDLDFSKTNLKQANFRDADLSNANFEDADLSRAALYGADLTNAKLYGARLTDARISDSTDFGIRGRGTLLPEFLPGVSPTPEVAYDPRSEPVPDDDGDVNNYTRAAAVYSELESLAEDNAAGKLARKCFIWRKDMQRLRYYSDDGDGNDRDLLAGLRASLSNGLMRYGESPYRLLGWAGLLVVACGLLYDHFDLLVPTPQGTTDPTISLLDALYFSTLTFTTLGMGDYRPVNGTGRALAIFETSAGVILLALLVFVFGRRATR